MGISPDLEVMPLVSLMSSLSSMTELG